MSRGARAALAAAAITCAATLAVTTTRAQTPSADAVRWSGTASGQTRREGLGAYTLPAVGTEPGGPAQQNGEVITSWQAAVRLIEGPPVDVKDGGTLVGVLVPLLDDGSSATIGMSGRMTERNPYGDVEHWDYSGPRVPVDARVTGNGAVYSGGWIYRSVAGDADPLKDILPNGTYALLGQPGVLKGFTVTITSIDAGHPGSPHKHQLQTGARSGWTVGYGLWAWSQLPAEQRASRGFGDAGGSISVDSLRRVIAATAAQVAQISGDDPKRFIADGAVMAGRSANAPTLSSSEATVTTSEWHLERDMHVDGTLLRVRASWRPEVDSFVSVTARLASSSGLATRFRFTLPEVSREVGVAINAGDARTPDLEFAAQDGLILADDHQSVMTSSNASEATVRVKALDYGAWGQVMAEALVNGVWVPVDAEGGGRTVSVPIDDDGNHIADSWEAIFGITGQKATDDLDSQPAPSDAAEARRRAGDGLSNYEEYRGFMQEGEWTFGYPGQRDVFIYDKLAHGTGWYSRSGLRVHLVAENELNRARFINFNRGYGTTGAQRGLILEARELDEGVAGEASDVGTPNVVEWVGVDIGKTGWDADPDEAASLIAHELGHASNLPHHGDPSATTGICRGADPMVTGVKGGQFSGDWDCIMRYTAATKYEGWDGVCHNAPWDPLTPGSFCRSRAGTGNNAGPNRMEHGEAYPFAGDATVGACMNHLMIRGVSRNGG